MLAERIKDHSCPYHTGIISKILINIKSTPQTNDSYYFQHVTHCGIPETARFKKIIY